MLQLQAGYCEKTSRLTVLLVLLDIQRIKFDRLCIALHRMSYKPSYEVALI